MYGGQTPDEVATGATPDVSQFICRTFHDPVHHYDKGKDFMSTKEQPGKWTGPAKPHCDAPTYWILSERSLAIYRPTIHAADDSLTMN